MRYVCAVLVCLSLMGCVSSVRTTTLAPKSPPMAGRGSVLVGQLAPDFEAAAVMPDGRFRRVRLSDYRGKYLFLVFYPAAFTFVCPTELIAFDERLKEFDAANCAIMAISVDTEHVHLAWKETSRDDGGLGQVGYPLVSDITKSISRSYGVLHDESVALRGTFLIDPKGKVRHALVNDLSIGRSVGEAMRTLKAVQFVDAHPRVCPANWTPGDKTMSPTRDGVKEYLGGRKK
jgi:peroxiredoxin 2/4